MVLDFLASLRKRLWGDRQLAMSSKSVVSSEYILMKLNIMKLELDYHMMTSTRPFFRSYYSKNENKNKGRSTRCERSMQESLRWAWSHKGRRLPSIKHLPTWYGYYGFWLQVLWRKRKQQPSYHVRSLSASYSFLDFSLDLKYRHGLAAWQIELQIKQFADFFELPYKHFHFLNSKKSENSVFDVLLAFKFSNVTFVQIILAPLWT